MSVAYERSSLSSFRSVLLPGSGLLELPHKRAEQTPKMVLARVSADAPDFAAIIDQHENRSPSIDRYESEVGRYWARDVDASKRGAL